ncbi:MAG TPA: Hint domain-containing protein [Candidatus Limnocylindria bacterium]|nr:Hint domain-containing protein [Candidatus Limnocylindria bacterium]
MKHSRIAVLPLVLAVVLAACAAGSPSPSPSPSPTPGGEPLSEAQVKYAILGELGFLWYCDPDFYPIETRPEQEAALEHWPEILADAESFAAIVEHLDWDAAREFTDADKLTAYREWKVLRAITLQTVDRDVWRFDVLTHPQPDAQAGSHTRGTITDRGAITIEQQEPDASGPNCPICLARGTQIDTPDGPVAVELLRVGDAVWTVDATGRRVAGVIEQVGSMTAPAEHRVVHLVLDDGRQAWISPGHPTADGRLVGDLRPGDLLDGATVLSAALEAYGGGTTFDLLPSGATGAYWANGILLGSTLSR